MIGFDMKNAKKKNCLNYIVHTILSCIRPCIFRALVRALVRELVRASIRASEEIPDRISLTAVSRETCPGCPWTRGNCL